MQQNNLHPVYCGDSYTNNTDQSLPVYVDFYNVMGHKQRKISELLPEETMLNTNPFNTVYIVLS